MSVEHLVENCVDYKRCAVMDNIKESLSDNKRRILPAIKLNPFGNLSRTQRFWLALKSVCRSYVENTAVHGFFYLRGVDNGRFKRIFWSIIIVVSFLMGAFILTELVAQFLRAPIQKTVGTPDKLLSISYPGVTLCHPQKVINYKVKQFVEKIQIPDGYDKAEVVNMLPSTIGVFTENQWGPVDANYLTTVNEILQLNGLSVLDVEREVGVNCRELVQRCSFNKKRFPCFQDHEHLTFRETMTYSGLCCSFNYNPYNSSYQPLKVNSYGVRGGLFVIASSFPHFNDGASGLLFSDGFVLFTHSPYDFPSESTSMALLGVGRITSIGIYPTILTVSAEVTALPLVSRRCLIGRDVGLSNYRRAACATKCMTQFISDKCDCHPYFLPAIDGSQIRNCSVTDGECFQRIYYDIRKIRCRQCLPACEDIIYKMSVATIPYNFAKVAINPIYDETNVTRSEFTAHIYFAGSTVPVRKTIVSQSFIQLLSNFGGVFNLVLGVSVFSILELLYYFCFKVTQLMQDHSKIRPVITTIHSKNTNFQ